MIIRNNFSKVIKATDNSKANIDNNVSRISDLLSKQAFWNKELSRLDKQAESISTAKSNQATKPRDLNEQVVWNEVLRNPGAGEPLANMNFNPVTGKSDPKFPTKYGFQKMQVVHELPNGQSITIHYQYNN